jgi:uncharacterized protein (TIGR04255 family)
MPDAAFEPKVLYRRSPLIEVTAQLCFPSILKIEAESPVAFQEQIRKDFPFFEAKPPTKPVGQVSFAGTILAIGQDQPTDTLTYVFDSADRRRRLTLSQKLLSLRTWNYAGWEEFTRHLSGSVDAFAKIYSPPFYHHVCLRYKNAIRREAIHLGSTPWSELLQPWISGPLGLSDIAADVDGVLNQWRMRVPEKGFYMDVASSLAEEQPSKTKVFLIETHTFTNVNTGRFDAMRTLDVANLHAGRFFQRCITGTLRSAFDPTTVG